MTKTKKAQKEQAQKSALRARIADIAAGSLGQAFGADEFATADFLSRFLPALQSLFGRDDNTYLWSPNNLSHYDNVDTTAAFLWENGIRA